MDRKILAEIFQNKNVIMLVTTIIFALGIISYFQNLAIIFSATLTTIFIVAILKNFISTKNAMILLFVFYFGFFLTSAKTRTYDELIKLAPSNATLQAQIVSIPNSNK